MVSSARVRLLEVDPDLGSPLSADELVEARQLAVPVLTVDRNDDLSGLNEAGIFAVLVLEGVVLLELRVADQLGMRLLGPGDIVSLDDAPPPMLVARSAVRTLPGTRLALLGRELLFAASRWPSLVAGLQARASQQAERLAAQLVICQLPRVDQRLLALLWLLAESWGRVTPAGVALPLKLTHEALGALVGARRPTVTLALRELTERGAIVRQNEGWLLLEAPPEAGQTRENLRIPELIERGSSRWARAAKPDAEADLAAAALASSESYALLTEKVTTLREQHARNRDQFADRLRTYGAARERCRATRTRIAGERLTRERRRSPSS